MNHESAVRNRGWFVVIAAVGINLVLGALYSWSVLGKALVGQWNWTKTDASLPFTASTIAFAITMIFAGRMQDKLGPRIAALLGGVLFGAGLALSGLAKSPLPMMITFGVIGGIGIGLGYAATTPSALKWFPPWKKGLIAGIVVSGVGMAPVYTGPLTAWLLRIGSIPQTFLILGIGTLVIITVCAIMLTNPPPGYVPAGTPPATRKSGPQTAASRSFDWNEMLRTWQFWALWVAMALTASAGLMIIVHIAIIAKMQAGIEWGYVAVASLAVFNSLGRLVSGYSSDKIGRANTMILFFALQMLNMLLFANYTTANLVLFGAAFTGLCYGTIFSLFPVITADLYGIKNLGVNYGFVFTAFGVAGALGPIMAGQIADATNSYKAAYLACAAMLLVGIVIAVLLRNTKVGDSKAEIPGDPAERELAGKA